MAHITLVSDDLPDLVQQVRAGVSEITDALVYDETTDPNDLLGRPNGYTGAASLTDSRHRPRRYRWYQPRRCPGGVARRG